MRFVRLALTISLLTAVAAPMVFAQNEKKPSVNIAQAPSIKNAPLPTDYMQGSKNAPVTIIEYASLTCPHCAHFHNTVYPALKKDFIDTGKARYILRPFPLNEPALKAAILVDCAVDIKGPEGYYTFVKVLFDTQNRWAFDANFINSLKAFAGVGGMRELEFDACIKDEARERKILQIKKTANEEVQVPHTPYFIVNGKPFNGHGNIETFAAHINMLAGDKDAAAPAGVENR
jgi:protein-disulfide isomerase